jgi:hypothetical protein
MKVISNPEDLNETGATAILTGELLDSFDSRFVVRLNDSEHCFVSPANLLKNYRRGRAMDTEASIFWDGVGTIKIDFVVCQLKPAIQEIGIEMPYSTPSCVDSLTSVCSNVTLVIGSDTIRYVISMNERQVGDAFFDDFFILR